MDDVERIARFKVALAERIGRQRYELWFARQTQFTLARDQLTVHVTSAFLRDWIRRNFSTELRDTCAEQGACDAKVEFEVDASLLLAAAAPSIGPESLGPCGNGTPSEPPPIAGCIDANDQNSQRADSAAGEADCCEATRTAARKAMTFENLVVAGSNQFAARAAEMIASGIHQASTVLFWGPTGVGKTHLLRAVQAACRRRQSRARAIYLTAEQFTCGFVDAVRGSGLPSFRHKCRGADLLLLDDVHFFAGKRATLEELLYTVDTLASDGRQVALASDRPPGELQSLGAELVSRLASGTVCEIGPPDYAMRVQIVRQLAHRMGMPLDDPCVELIATHVTGGARELRGALHRLELASAVYRQAVDRQLIDGALSELALHNARPVKLADIQTAVCDVFGVDAGGLRSDNKSRALSEPRMLAMWLARKYTRAPLSEIGEFFGRRSHSTVISAQRRVERLMSEHGTVGMANKPCAVEDAIRRVETVLRKA